MERVLDGWVDAAAKVMWSICYGKEGHRPKGEMLALLVNLCSYPQLWVKTKKKRCLIQAAKTSFLRRVVGRSVGEELCNPEKVQSRAAGAPHQEVIAMVATRMSPSGGVSWQVSP